jgi:hypothetical protein
MNMKSTSTTKNALRESVVPSSPFTLMQKNAPVAEGAERLALRKPFPGKRKRPTPLIRASASSVESVRGNANSTQFM